MTDGPKLLVEWSSPWQEFVTAIGPALGRSPARLAGEAQTGLFPVRGMLLSWGLQAIFLAALIWIPAKLVSMRPYVPPTPPKYDVIYFSADELPQTADRGGAQAGKSGRAGGQEAFHRTQTIRVARGSSTAEKVVDAPDLKLPISSDPVKNLLAFKHVPGPPPAEGLKRSINAPTLSKDAIVAPPPTALRELSRATPALGNAVIAPPPASVSQDRARQTMGLTTAIIQPAPKDVPHDQSRSVMAMNSPIIQPAPTDVQREPPPLRGPAASAATIVPPPVSAPLRDTTQTPKLALPAPAVIAPPPSQVVRDQRSVTGASLVDPKVVPPPVQLGGRSQDRQAILGPSGANQIVPPPPSVSGGTALAGGGRGHSDKAGGFGATLGSETVVPPPPSISADASRSGSGRGPGDPRGSLGGTLGAPAVVPPPPSLGSPGGALSGHGTGTLGATSIVPPPPSITDASGSPVGRGMGNRGGGIGGPFDKGTVLAPPTTAGGNSNGKGVVVSPQPGSAEGLPGNGSAGSIAMSPAGAAKTGAGGSGGGPGIGHGNGPGSGLTGEGSGAAKSGSGRGSDANAHGGISPYPGQGGAGNGANGQPAVPGVSVQGGSTITLPSFGSNESDPNSPSRSSAGGGRSELDVTVEGTSRSGGAFNFYGLLKGDKVYTKYLPTVDGTVVMQFADASSAGRPYGQELTSPQPLRTDLPTTGIKRSRIVIACVLDRSGMLRSLQVLKADPGVGTSRILAALSAWKFTPAQRGSQPVEVNAILGFNIDTR
jgi:hypothetical protein